MVNQISKNKKFILTAFLTRSLLVIAEQLGILTLPDGNLIFSDANRLELIAREFFKRRATCYKKFSFS